MKAAMILFGFLVLGTAVERLAGKIGDVAVALRERPAACACK